MAVRRSRMASAPLRINVDASVFGGVHDREFRDPSERFFAAVRRGHFSILVSDALVVEIASAPTMVQAIFEAHQGFMEPLETTAEAAALAEAYLAASVVPSTSRVDALHVALASVARADAVVSWNFKHLVQLRRIRGFHAVNVLRGYPLIEIRSPREVIDEGEPRGDRLCRHEATSPAIARQGPRRIVTRRTGKAHPPAGGQDDDLAQLDEDARQAPAGSDAERRGPALDGLDPRSSGSSSAFDRTSPKIP